MPGPLTHSPAEVLQWLLVALGEASSPAAKALGAWDADDWPVYSPNEPPAPDNCLTVALTEGKQSGRDMVSGERQEHHGFQVRVRGTSDRIAWTKARAIGVLFDTGVVHRLVSFDSAQYVVWSITRTGDILTAGRAGDARGRSLRFINGLISLRQH